MTEPVMYRQCELQRVLNGVTQVKTAWVPARCALVGATVPDASGAWTVVVAYRYEASNHELGLSYGARRQFERVLEDHQ